MEKKLISGVIATAVALTAAMPVDAAKPNAAVGLDNPLDEPSCAFDEGGFVAGWFDPEGDDSQEGDTKYGGDIEFDALLSYTCDFAGTEAEGAEGSEASETAIVDVDLSRDESEPFFYVCEYTGNEEQVGCDAAIDNEDVQNAINEAAADRWADVECSVVVEVCTEFACNVEGFLCENGGESFPVTCEEGEVSGSECEGGEWVPFCEGQVVEGCLEYSNECTESSEQTVLGNFETFGATLTSATFSVKEMNPGKGNGKQNYEKVYAECNFP